MITKISLDDIPVGLGNTLYIWMSVYSFEYSNFYEVGWITPFLFPLMSSVYHRDDHEEILKKTLNTRKIIPEKLMINN